MAEPPFPINQARLLALVAAHDQRNEGACRISPLSSFTGEKVIELKERRADSNRSGRVPGSLADAFLGPSVPAALGIAVACSWACVAAITIALASSVALEIASSSV
jgi:hypothetical protein